jgi:hypothetical protein
MTITIMMITATITTITPVTIMITRTALRIMYRHTATDMITGTTTACCGSRRPGAWLWRWPSP